MYVHRYVYMCIYVCNKCIRPVLLPKISVKFQLKIVSVTETNRVAIKPKLSVFELRFDFYLATVNSG